MSETSTSTALAPIEKKRQKIFEAMSVPCQEIATDINNRLAKYAVATAVVWHDLGAYVSKITRDPEKYGNKSIAQLAAYFNFSEQQLQNLRIFAESFDRDYVRTWSEKVMANGGYITMQHWIKLMTLKSDQEKDRLLQLTIRKGLSAAELAAHIKGGGTEIRSPRASGGRKHHVPSSPQAGLHKALLLANKFTAFETIFEKHVASAFDEIDEENASEAALEKLKETHKAMETLRTSAGAAEDRLSANIKHMQTMLEAKEEAEKAAAKEEKDAKKAAAKHNAGSNGKATTKKTAHKPARRPAAAT